MLPLSYKKKKKQMLPSSMERAKDSLGYGTRRGNLYSMIHFLRKTTREKGYTD